MVFILENKFSSSRLKLKSRKEIRFDFIVFTNKTVNYNMDSTFGDRVVTNYFRKRVTMWQFIDRLVAMT